MYKKDIAKSKKGKLTRDHPILNGDERNSRVIIITSVVTMRSRHRPSALKNYRIRHLKYTQQDADDLITVNDPNWAYNLEGLLDRITVDEARILKDRDTMAHKTVAWLKPKFSILVTATVLSNRVEDFRGYI